MKNSQFASELSCPFFYIRETTFNIALSSLFGFTSYRFFINYIESERLSSLVFVCFQALLALFSLIRKYPERISFNWKDWIVACLGTCMMFAIWPVGEQSYRIGEIFQMVGLVITCFGLVSLNRSYASIPADRGIKTNGLYRIIRHPLYSGYILSDIGIFISNVSVWNTGVVALAITFQVVRMQREERFLAKNPIYSEYMQNTHYRILPKIW